jgi:hydroxyethylthiazole kinase-like uncharacterized protein yjeF
MRGVYSVAEVRAAERVLLGRLPEGTLMQRAAHALSVHCADVLDRVYGARVALLVGTGNNGGDALFAGARLARRGARVSALLLDPQRAHDRGTRAAAAAGVRIAAADPARLRGADLVVDGIFGIGGRAGLRGLAADLAYAAAPLLTVAVDVPSGVDADTGDTGDTDDEAVRADVTVTFGALKAGLVAGPGAALSGQVRLVDIGLALPAPRTRLLEAPDVRALLPQPHASDDKYTRGVVGVAAGSLQYGGAGVLATGGAVHGGAGMVRYAGTAPEQVRARFPEVIVHDGAHPSELKVQAWVVGPGIGTGGGARNLLADVLRTDVPVIADADALTLIGAEPQLLHGRSAPTVLTPHEREFARLGGDLGADRIAAASRVAVDLGVVLLLKGNTTVVASPDREVCLNPTGTPWLGTAGSGDVLSGLIGALLASGLPAAKAAPVGAYLHGVAGQLAASGGVPSSADVLAALPRAYAAVLNG